MTEPDPLAAEFAALRAAVLTRPPGPAAAERTVRRRRRRAAALTTSFAVVLVAAMGAAAFGFAGTRYRTPPAVLAPSAPSPGSPYVVPPVLSASAIPHRSTAPAAPVGSGSGSCRRYGAVQVDLPMLTTVSVRVDLQGPYPLCTGERVRVFVATYSVDARGQQNLYRSQTGYLDAAHNPLTLAYQVPPCHATIYVISGNQPIRQTIPAMTDFYKQAPSVYYTTAAGPYGGVVWLQELDPCSGSNYPAYN